MDSRRDTVGILKRMITLREENGKEKNRRKEIYHHPWLQWYGRGSWSMVVICGPSPSEMGANIRIRNWGVYNPDSSSTFCTSSKKNFGYAQSSFWKVLEVWLCQTWGLSVCVWKNFLNKCSKFRILWLHGSGLWWREIGIEKLLYHSFVVSVPYSGFSFSSKFLP